MINIKNISKIYNIGSEKLTVLDDVSLNIEKGEFVAIVGASGSGKSTLMNMIGGLDRPSRGEVIIEGEDISKFKDKKMSKFRNEKIGFKIRERTLERIPYLLVLGDREVEEGTVNVRTRSGKNLGTMSIDAFIDLVKSAVAERGRYIVE